MSLSLGTILSACRQGRWLGVASRAMRPDAGQSSRAKWKPAKGVSATPGIVDCYGLSDIGKVRERNEDQFLIADMMEPVAIRHTLSTTDDEIDARCLSKANLLLVADGVGGNAGGERASRLATEGIVEYLHNHRKQLLGYGESRESQIHEELKSALSWAQERIQREAEASPQVARMGTTLTLAYLDWPTAYIAHVGDSRAYLYRRPDLFQLTRDQTIAQQLADAGAIEADQIGRHPFRNMLSSLLCCERNQLSPCVYQRQLAPGDQLLLCTDGITKYISASEIAEILDGAYSAADGCRELIGMANAAGGADNLTVVLACFGRGALGSVENAQSAMEASTVIQLHATMACSA